MSLLKAPAPRRPALSATEFEYVWAFDDEGNTATCVLEFQPAEVYGGTLRAAYCSLRGAYIGDTCISMLLRRDQEQRIERLALAEKERAIREDAAEALIDNYCAREAAYV